ncbi:hypothetical protein [Magnetofaba australis]|uniref:Uncharacterized protein n=1 Tax=Magnetofaba australis IT-1 TaxID=1434232 RepID=A0A1Y2K6G5_9PROT|nr:hypothetical protein [Magnetofaba australis]OSM04887.1 hypothetical protein MAIT1_02990 [Magnetofaba australis IT-1]
MLRFFGAILFLLLCAAGLAYSTLYMPNPEQSPRYLIIEASKAERLPLAPHVRERHARPTDEMRDGSQGRHLRFRVLDKRTLRVHALTVRVGESVTGPWGGEIKPTAFVSDLQIRSGDAVHGPDGLVNPAVWLELTDAERKPLHEGWLFARDNAQTAWDNHRFDLTFLGLELPPPVEADKDAAES